MDDDLVAYRVRERESVLVWGRGKTRRGVACDRGHAIGDYAIAIVGQAVQLRGSTVYRAR